MKIILRFLFPVLFLIVLSSFALHKFYVGIYQVNYVAQKKEVQVTARIFIDDLEKALERKHKKKLYLATPKEVGEANEFIKGYLEDKFQLKINKSIKHLQFLGKEVEDNVFVIYLKTPVSEKISALEIYNSVLTEIYSDQQNIIHTNINGNKKSLLLTDNEPEGEIEY